uniref:VP6 protein n=1 Tax=Equine encephalosis virus TaxID=201490 RepID=A0A891ZT90_9REOV|nr:VP6 protein [Equine encephalosis virus]
MSSGLFLAPGDVLEKGREKLKQLGIEVKIKPWQTAKKEDGLQNGSADKGNTGSGELRGAGKTGATDVERVGGDERGGSAGEDGRELAQEAVEGRSQKKGAVRTEGGTDGGEYKKTAGEDGISSGPGSNGRTPAGGSRGEEKATERGARRLQKTEGGKEVPADGAGRDERGDDGGRGRGSEYRVLAEGVAECVYKKYGIKLPVGDGEGKVIIIEKALSKDLKIDPDDYQRQFDELKAGGGKGGKIQKEQIISVNSKGKLESLLKVDARSNLQETIKGDLKYRLGTNDISAIGRATMIFSTSTGDTGWKEVMREAAKNANIMMYTHEGDSDPIVHLITLLEHL